MHRAYAFQPKDNFEELSEYIISYYAYDKPLYEGFLAGTLVSTPHGLVPIEQLAIGDTVNNYQDDGACTSQKITAISNHHIDEYLTIETPDETIAAAPHQKFYVADEEQWVHAQDLTPRHKLLTIMAQGILVQQVKKVNQTNQAYVLTVNDHVFYVTPHAIHVHNSDAVFEAAWVVLKIGKLVCKHPVVALLGDCIDIANGCAVVHNFITSLQASGKNQAAPQQYDGVVLQERFIYESAKRELEKIKQEQVAVLEGLKKLRQLSSGDITDFTHNFLQTYSYPAITNPLCIVSSAQEAQYTLQQKEALRAVRQAELDQLEEQIANLQITLGMHLHCLIEQRNQLLAAATTELNAMLSLAKAKTLQPNSFTKDKAVLFYEKVIATEEALPLLESKNKELKLTVNYYKISTNAALIKKTSNIMEVIAAEERAITMVEDFIHKQQIALVDYKKAAMQHLAALGYAATRTGNQTAQQRKNYNAKALATAQQQRAAIQPPQNPKKGNNKKDDKEDDANKHPHGIYEDAGYHHVNSSGRKSPAPKNGQAALDVSVPCPKDESEPSNFRHRIAICDEKIVVLRQTSEGKYHGYVCSWEDLESHMQKALKRHNLVTKKGKII